MTAELILAVDQGTTSTRAIVFDRRLAPVASASRLLETVHPQPGWSEQDPDAILESVVETVADVLRQVGGPDRIAVTGLDNPGETVVAWDAESGNALAPAILWECRRSEEIVERLRAAGREAEIRARTGLPLDPYFSAGKLAWLLANSGSVLAANARGTLRLGTVDAWLTARLDDGRARTDVSTGSRTQLVDIRTCDWDDELLGWFGVPRESLPPIVTSAGDLGTIHHERWGGSLRVAAMACDQQAALAGHAAFATGSVKATFGTGVFVLANAGSTPASAPGIETSVAWSILGGPASYVLQGGVFSAGSFLGWLERDLPLIPDADGADVLAASVEDSAGVRVLPALSGLGAPWWRPRSRAVIAGLSAATRPEHVAHAALEGIGQLTADVVEAIAPGLPKLPTSLRVDGGLTASRFLMGRTADLLGIPVDVAEAPESTALGVAGLAGLGAGLFEQSVIGAANPVRIRFEPRLTAAKRGAERASWRRFVASAAEL
jgi:glycerol kinase